MGLMGPPPFISPSVVSAPSHHPGHIGGDPQEARGKTPVTGGPSWAAKAKGLFQAARREKTRRHN